MILIFIIDIIININIKKKKEPRSNIPWLKKILFPHLTNISSTGNSNTLFIIPFTTIYLHNLSPHMSSQPITSRIYQRLLYQLTNQISTHVFTANHITHLPTATLSTDQSNRSPGFLNFQLSNTATWLWRWIPHRLLKRQSLTTVLHRTPITQMIFFNQGISILLSLLLLTERLAALSVFLLKRFFPVDCNVLCVFYL